MATLALKSHTALSEVAEPDTIELELGYTSAELRRVEFITYESEEIGHCEVVYNSNSFAKGYDKSKVSTSVTGKDFELRRDDGWKKGFKLKFVFITAAGRSSVFIW